MKIREVMSSPAYTCTPGDSLANVASKLWEHDVGLLVVVDEDGKAGAVITDRDICMGALTHGLPLAEIPVADSMSRELLTCVPEDDIDVAVAQMSEHQVHRLPVVDAEGKALGMLSLNDLAVVSVEHPTLGKKTLKVLEALCRHRTGVPATAPATAKAQKAKATPKPKGSPKKKSASTAGS